MRGRLVRIGAAVFVASAILLVLVVLVPSRRSLSVGIYELVLAAIVVGSLVGSFRTFEPEAWMRSPFERDTAKAEEPQPIAELDRIANRFESLMQVFIDHDTDHDSLRHDWR